MTRRNHYKEEHQQQKISPQMQHQLGFCVVRQAGGGANTKKAH